MAHLPQLMSFLFLSLSPTSLLPSFASYHQHFILHINSKESQTIKLYF